MSVSIYISVQQSYNKKIVFAECAVFFSLGFCCAFTQVCDLLTVSTTDNTDAMDESLQC